MISLCIWSIKDIFSFHYQQVKEAGAGEEVNVDKIEF